MNLYCSMGDEQNIKILKNKINYFFLNLQLGFLGTIWKNIYTYSMENGVEYLTRFIMKKKLFNDDAPIDARSIMIGVYA